MSIRLSYAWDSSARMYDDEVDPAFVSALEGSGLVDYAQ